MIMWFSKLGQIQKILVSVSLPISCILAANVYFRFESNTLLFLTITFFTALLGALSLMLVKANKRLKKHLINQKFTERVLSKLSNAVTNSGASILITSSNGTIEFVNSKFESITGWQSREVVGQSVEMLTSEECQDTDKLGRKPSVLCLKDNFKGEVFSKKKSGEGFWSAITVTTVRDERNNITNYVVSGIDISELKEANQKMEKLALFDSLTGLANRRLFQDRLEQSIKNAKRHGNSVALLFLDLDKFKRINDTLGHDAGDLLLLTVAKRLQSCVRSQDTVARLGGDEFTILLNDITDSNDVTTVAKNILSALKEPIKLSQQEVIVSTSIGITLSPEDSSHTETLMKNADLALYKAKERGRDGYYFFTEELNTKALHQLMLEQELRHGLQFNEFSLLFQPQVHMNSGEVQSVEALIRWNHPLHGSISPGKFIDVAEETGLIVPIGNWVLKNACVQIKLIQELTGCPIRVAVNLSARQFKDPRLERVILDSLEASGLSAEHLELEVTESMLMDDIQTVTRRLESIKATGVTITIDDFGSGYSSLRHLKRLPVDKLKVDRAFVKEIPDDLNDMEITAAVIAIAHKMNLKVIAEGVENIDQRDFLVINKCDYAQGFYFSEPKSFEELYQYFLPLDALKSAS